MSRGGFSQSTGFFVGTGIRTDYSPFSPLFLPCFSPISPEIPDNPLCGEKLMIFIFRNKFPFLGNSPGLLRVYSGLTPGLYPTFSVRAILVLLITILY